MAQLQNIPSRNKASEYDDRIQKLGPEIRDVFEAPEGYVLIVCDLSQLELRLGAHITHDPTLLGVYREHEDFEGYTFYTGDPHSETSRRMGVPRKLAKNLNFGLMYGMRAENFARYARLYKPGTKIYDVAAAERYVNAFHRTYAGVFDYHEELRRSWWEGTRVFSTVCGRLRHFDNYERVAAGKIYNSKIQGSAADIMKVQMWAFMEFIFNQPDFAGLRPVIQVHDEYVFEAPEETAQQCAVMVKFIMEYPFFVMDVPLLASAKICKTWKQKDDDTVPEVGTFFAKVKDPTVTEKKSLDELAAAAEPRLFKPTDWEEYLKLEEQDRIVKKSAVAMLSSQQKSWAQTFLSSDLPTFTPQRAKRIIPLEEYMEERKHAFE